MINYVDKMADALVDVLKYSNQDVEWVEPDDMKPNDGVQPECFGHNPSHTLFHQWK